MPGTQDGRGDTVEEGAAACKRPARVARRTPPAFRDPVTTPVRRSRNGRRAPRFAALLLAGAVAAGCGASRAPDDDGGPPVRPGWTQTGEASWYGPGFHGRTTASGETYDQEAMTAAHRTLPLGSRIRVTVPATGRTTELVVNDRGPFVEDRVLDVSRAAARRLGFLEQGTARVRLEVISLPEGCRQVQVGSFRDRDNAVRRRDRLRDAGEPARLEEGPDGRTRVVAGPYGSEERARRVRERWGGWLRGCDG